MKVAREISKYSSKMDRQAIIKNKNNEYIIV